MRSHVGFPQELLEKSVSERVSFFQNYTMPHQRLHEAADQVINAIRQPSGASLVFVFGPSGVGKTTLLRRVNSIIIDSALDAMNNDKGYIPSAGIEAMAPESGNFDWKDFYIRSLRALSEPLIDKKISRTDTKLKLRFALESALKYRNPEAFFIDEAQNLGRVVSGQKLLDQTDCIKSLANISRTQFVLCGTYELLSLRNLSAQLCRRSTDIHFSRYKINSTDDVKAYKGVIRTFQKYLPLLESPKLVNDWQFCYERSVGCVGILKDWFTRTLNGVLEQDSQVKTITVEDLEKYAWPPQQCLKMAEELLEGEKELEEKEGTVDSLRLALGISSDLSEKDPPLLSSKSASQKGRKVGQPNPKRRPVGIEPNA